MATRREFIKRSTLAGAVVWTAPVVVTLPAGAAWANQYGQQGTCQPEATALKVILGDRQVACWGRAIRPVDGEVCAIQLGKEMDEGSFRIASPNTPLLVGPMQISVDVACGQVFQESSDCKAVARVLDLTLEFHGDRDGDPRDRLLDLDLSSGQPTSKLRFQLLAAEADGSTDPSVPTIGTSSLAGTTIYRLGDAQSLFLVSDCNYDVTLLRHVRIIANEQICQDDCLTVRALRIVIPTRDGRDLQIIAAETSVRGAGPCRACS